jgi:hypothetical protein
LSDTKRIGNKRIRCAGTVKEPKACIIVMLAHKEEQIDA